MFAADDRIILVLRILHTSGDTLKCRPVARSGIFVVGASAVAQQVARSGANIVAIVEATRPSEWLPHAAALWGQWPRFKEAFNYWRGLRGVPVAFGHKIVRAIGDGCVEAAEIAAVDKSWHAAVGSHRRLEADAIALAYGFLPNIEIAEACGCELAWDPFGTAWFVRCDERMATSADGMRTWQKYEHNPVIDRLPDEIMEDVREQLKAVEGFEKLYLYLPREGPPTPWNASPR